MPNFKMQGFRLLYVTLDFQIILRQGRSNKIPPLLININIFHLAGDDILANFAKETWNSAKTLNEPYDFASIMHYEK